MSEAQHCDVVVVGGGLVGACLADELAAAGRQVVVLDAGSQPGHASGKAAGVAVPSLRYLLDPEFYRWLAEGGAELERDLERLEPEHGSFSRVQPVMRLLSEADVAALAGVEPASAVGEPVDRAEVERLAPGLRIPADRQPYVVEGGRTVRGTSYLEAVRTAAVRAGVDWRQDRTVSTIEETGTGVQVGCVDGTRVAADRVVVTAGAWTGQLVDVPVVPQRGQLVLLDISGLPLNCIVSGRHYLAPLPGGGLLVGATEEDSGFDQRSTAGSVTAVLAFALRMMPGLAGAQVLENRSGLRPVTASGYPVTGRAPGHQRVYVAAGHAGHGLLTARVTARGMLAGLERGDWTALPESFCPRDPVGAAEHAGAKG